MQPRGIGGQIRRLLLSGRFTYAAIARRLCCTKSTISYHAAQIGQSRGRRFPKYDWNSIQRFHNQGHTRAECLTHFRLSENAWEYAQRKGYLSTHPIKTPLTLVLKKGYRRSIKRRLILEGVLTNRCALCDCDPIWLGKPLTLHLDHINGFPTDYRIENLRLVCPNCDSQLETFAGRNRNWRRKQAATTQEPNLKQASPRTNLVPVALV